ncbi:hypothetical protein L7F22_053201 [Adiantum nelumboides]|nr:hypothetical protein [Adiantum nelumboides]
MNIHILGVGSIGTLLAFHIQRAIRLSNSTKPISSSSSSIPSNTSLTLHLRRSSFPNSSNSIQNRSSNHPSVDVRVESNGVTQIESGLKVEFLPSLNRLSSRTIDRFNQSNLDKRRNQIESDWKKEKIRKEKSGLVLNQDESQKELESRLDSLKSSSSPNSTIPFIPPPFNSTIPSDEESKIDFLIITTKADSTINAIRPLLYRLNQDSTILLLQNGMGILDELIQTFFQDQSTRPQFLLGITTHGCFRKKGTWIVHAGNGTVDLTVVPGRKSLGLENGGFDRVQKRLLFKGDESHSNAKEEKSVDMEKESINKLPRFLNLLQSLPLSVSLDSISEFQLKSLKKLIINSCINPLTSILEVRNGELVGNENIRNMIKGICGEAEEIFIEMSKRRIDSDSYQRENQRLNGQISNTSRRDKEEDGEEEEEIDLENLNSLDLLTLAITRPTTSSSGQDLDSNRSSSLGINPSLLSEALVSQVEKISISTAKNWSSMAQDLGVNGPSIKSCLRESRGKEEVLLKSLILMVI